jgi:amino acid adenylation domain-containing protein
MDAEVAQGEPLGFRSSPQQARLMALAIGDSMARIEVETAAALDPDRVQDVVASLVDRLEILRTTCTELPGYPEPVQQVGILPVVRASVTVDAGGSRLTLELPATAADALTLRLLAAEVLAAHDGRAGWIGADTLQYADVAAWLNDLIEEDELRPPAGALAELDDTARSWSRAVSGTEAPVAPRLSTTPITVPLDRGTSDLLRSLAVAELTADDLVRAALVVARWRWTGSDRFLLAEVMPGRTRADLDAVVGPIARHIPIWCDVDPAERFLTLARRLAASVAAAAAWQDHFDWSTTSPGPAAPPEYVDLAFEADHVGTGLEVSGAGVEIVSIVAHADRFDWKLTTRSGPDGLLVEVHRDEAVIAAGEATMFAEVVAGVLDAVVPVLDAEGAGPRVDDMGLACERKPGQTVELGSGPPIEDRPACLHELLRAQVRATPDRPAVVFGDRSVRFGDLDRRSDSIAHALVEHGVQRGELVGILAPPSDDLIAVMFGIWKAGAAYVPLDTTAPPSRTAESLLEAEIRLVVSAPGQAHSLPSSAATWWVDQIDSTCTASARSLPAVEPDDAAYAIFTSGSTGRPKAVLVEHRNVDALRSAMKAAIPDLRPDRPAVAALNASVTFDASLQQIVLLLDGHTLHVLPDEVRRDDALLIAFVREHGIEVLNGTPTQIKVLVAAGLLDAPGHALRILLIAGERLPLDLWARLAADARITAYNIYGPTECTVNATAARIRSDAAPSIGSPLAGYDVRIVDDRLRLVPPGCPGEVCLGGLGVARGYLGRPALTAAHFVPDPWGPPGSRLYRTGDVARLDPSGHLAFVGRRDEQIKLRGFRIEPAELETLLLEHPAVGEAAVVLHAGDDGHPSLVAYVAPASIVAPVLGQLRDHLTERLPPHLVPSSVVPLDQLPRTVTGKVDRRALPAPETRGRTSGAAYAPPRSATEATLVEVWTTVLGGRIGIDDPFFSIGGDSIRSIRIRNLAADAGLAFTVQQLFEHQTIRSLAASCTGHAAVEPSRSLPAFAMVPAASERPGIVDALPVASTQSNMLYHEAIDPSRPMFRSTRTMRLRGAFDADALRQALREVAADHPILRSTMDLTSYDEPVQLMHRDLLPSLVVQDLRPLGVTEQQARIAEHWRTDRATAFDWAEEPLARIAVHRVADEEVHFGITVHQAAFDGWSVASMLNELLRRYVAHLDGAPLPASPPFVTYATFVEAEREASADAASAAAWRTEAERGVGMVLPGIQGGERRPDHRTIIVPVPTSTADALGAMATSSGVPLKSVLLAVHLRVVASLAGSSAIRTGVVTHGRSETADGERVLGQFLNTIPFALDLDGRSWTDLARQVFDHEIGLRPHRRFPVALMEREAGGPLFDTVFNFTHFHVHTASSVDGLDLVADEFDELTDIGLLADFSLDPRTQELRLTLAIAGLDEERIAGVAQAYAVALEAVAAGPDDPHEVVFTGLAVGPPSLEAGEDVGMVLAERIGGFGDEIAVTAPGEAMTYAELDARSAWVSSLLGAADVGTDSIVVLRGRRGPSMVSAIVGVLRAGSGYFIADQDSRDLTDEIIRRAEPAMILDVDTLFVDTDTDARPAPSSGDPGGVAYLVATSGTTGAPRLVAVERRGLLNHLRTKVDLLALGSDSTVAQSARGRFDVSVWQQLAVLLVGGTVAIIPDEVMSDPSSYLRAVAEVGATHAQIVPSVLAASLADGVPPVPLPRLRVMVSTGDELTLHTARRWAARYPVIPLVNAYGPAEVTDQATQATWRADVASCPIGSPIAGVRADVGDDRGRHVPFPGVGELYLSGAQLARGYLADPAATADRFRPDPAGRGARRYRTGDIVRTRSDGGLEFLGRADRQVQINGIRVEPAGIEAIFTAIDGVREVAVVPIDDGGRTRLAAYVAADGVSATDLTAVARRELPRVAVPTRFRFTAGLPRTPAGKVDRRALVALGSEEHDAPRPTTRRSPRNPVEVALQSCWSAVLERPVGIDDDFFDVGGDSFAAVRVVARLAADHRLECGVRDIMEGRTIAELAERIRQ